MKRSISETESPANPKKRKVSTNESKTVKELFDKAVSLKKTDTKAAFELYQQASSLNHLQSRLRVGICCMEGTGTAKDLKMAKEIFEELSSQHEKGIAVHNLAYSYEKGDHGVPKDIKKSIELYEKSANLGRPESLFNLGIIYRDGIGISKDLPKAFKMMLQSATMTPPYVQSTEEVAFCYFHGKGVAQNYEKAFEWFSKGASLGLKACVNGLGFMYDMGLHVAENKYKAFELFSKAASMNHPLAIFNVGVCYEKGSGISKDEAKAFEHFQSSWKRSQERGHHECQNVTLALARCHEKGVGTKRDLLEAIKWYRLSQNEEEVFKRLSSYKSEICEKLLSIPLLESENEKLKQEIEELQARPGGETFWKAKEEFEKFVLK